MNVVVPTVKQDINVTLKTKLTLYTYTKTNAMNYNSNDP